MPSFREEQALGQDMESFSGGENLVVELEGPGVKWTQCFLAQIMQKLKIDHTKNLFFRCPKPIA